VAVGQGWRAGHPVTISNVKDVANSKHWIEFTFRGNMAP